MSFALVDESGGVLADDAVLVAKGGQAAAAASVDAKPGGLFAPQRLRLTRLSTVRTALELRDEIKQLRQRLAAVSDAAAAEQQRRVVAEREAQRLRVALRREREASAQHRQESAAAAAVAAAGATRSTSAEGLPDSWAVAGSDVLLAEKLSEGTTADVYAGTFRGQTVAVKVIKATMLDEHRAAFAQECSIMSSLRSPHTVFFFGAVTEPTVMLVFEYCARGSLYDVLNDRHLSPTLSWPLALSLLRQCALGVQSLHEWKPTIVHRDLKSGNLMVNEDFTLKIGDFGIAQLMDPAAATTVTEDESDDESSGNALSSEHTMRGTFAYVAPEVYHGEEFTPASDVYSLGIISWEVIHRLMTGSYDAPFVREHTISHAFQIVLLAATRGVRPTLPPKAPASLVALTQACWAHEQAGRPSAAQIIARLDAALVEYEGAAKTWDRLCKGVKRSRLDGLFAKAATGGPTSTSPGPVRSAQVRDLVSDGRVRSMSLGAKK
jgi:serine/threonine protein kinase